MICQSLNTLFCQFHSYMKVKRRKHSHDSIKRREGTKSSPKCNTFTWATKHFSWLWRKNSVHCCQKIWMLRDFLLAQAIIFCAVKFFCFEMEWPQSHLLSQSHTMALQGFLLCSKTRVVQLWCWQLWRREHWFCQEMSISLSQTFVDDYWPRPYEELRLYHWLSWFSTWIQTNGYNWQLTWQKKVDSEHGFQAQW